MSTPIKLRFPPCRPSSEPFVVHLSNDRKFACYEGEFFKVAYEDNREIQLIALTKVDFEKASRAFEKGHQQAAYQLIIRKVTPC